jgi:osmotically-inducible protein OsmY
MNGRVLAAVRVSLVIVLVLCGIASARAAEPDAWITMKTKVSLMTTDGIHTSDLNVDTVKGVVTLHGKVSTEAEKAKASLRRFK